MMLFNLLMLKHLNSKRLIRDITSTRIQIQINLNSNNERHLHRIEKQLIRLSFIQIFIYIFFNLPNAIYVVYMLITTNDSKTDDVKAIESFVSSFVSILTFIYCTVSINSKFSNRIFNVFFSNFL